MVFGPGNVTGMQIFLKTVALCHISEENTLYYILKTV